MHATGVYLHLEPGSVFVGASFDKHFTLWGESMKRPPRGYDPDHPLVEDLKRKDFIVMRKLSEKDACSAAFQKQVLETCRAAKPILSFLTAALELDF